VLPPRPARPPHTTPPRLRLLLKIAKLAAALETTQTENLALSKRLASVESVVHRVGELADKVAARDDELAAYRVQLQEQTDGLASMRKLLEAVQESLSQQAVDRARDVQDEVEKAVHAYMRHDVEDLPPAPVPLRQQYGVDPAQARQEELDGQDLLRRLDALRAQPAAQVSAPSRAPPPPRREPSTRAPAASACVPSGGAPARSSAPSRGAASGPARRAPAAAPLVTAVRSVGRGRHQEAPTLLAAPSLPVAHPAAATPQATVAARPPAAVPQRLAPNPTAMGLSPERRQEAPLPAARAGRSAS
jgi:hypothetical protein